MTADLLIVGTGLIGTSLALALRHERDVVLTDEAPDTLSAALQRGAGRRWDGREQVSLAVVCAPPGAVAGVLSALIHRQVAQTLSHVGSVQTAVQAEVESLQGLVPQLCGGHPMAGRERSGPGAATGKLFVGRTWAVCPSPHSSAGAVAAVRELAVAVGAHPALLSPEDHDRAVALVSHLPQLAASALAAQLVRAPASATDLGGPGLQDSTRIASSDSDLWREIVRLNAANLAPLVQGLAGDLARLAAALETLTLPPEGQPDRAAALDVVSELLRRGVQGRESVPRKRGEHDAAFVSVSVSVQDAPGQLAALLSTAGDGQVNVEDVRVDHVPDTPRGIIELDVRPAARDRAVEVLRAAGWEVLGEDE
ncbi:MAG: prephenate dehydrogenase [Frankiales bacterium]|nr:prephenate dehydrogenase [Frankiales bacterium]